MLGAEFFQENKGDFWGILETRSYMRARPMLADFLVDAGRMAEAIRHCETIVQLNPNDNQGVRRTLLAYYLSTDKLEGARRPLQEYAEDDTPVFLWGRMLERVFPRTSTGRGSTSPGPQEQPLR